MTAFHSSMLIWAIVQEMGAVNHLSCMLAFHACCGLWCLRSISCRKHIWLGCSLSADPWLVCETFRTSAVEMVTVNESEPLCLVSAVLIKHDGAPSFPTIL